jgi:hypothetical protein
MSKSGDEEIKKSGGCVRISVAVVTAPNQFRAVTKPIFDPLV